MIKNNVNLKLPKSLDLGTVLPGHYGESALALSSGQASFLTLTFSSKSLLSGFFMLKEGSNQCMQSLNIVLKPNKNTQIFVGCYPKQVSQSTQFKGQLIVSQSGKQNRIKLIFRIQIPKIICKKMLQDTSRDSKIVRLVVNKAVTSDVRIPLFNPQQYSLELSAGLLIKSSIADKENPFILKPHGSTIKAQPKQQFFVFVNIATNIGYKNDHKGLKKIVFRNVLTLSTNSVLIWCLPIQLIIVFVKQPQYKTDQ